MKKTTLTKEQRKDIALEYKLDNSKENAKRLIHKYNISERRLYQIVKENATKELEQSINDNASDFSKRANKIIQMVFDRMEKQLQEDDKITLSQLSTTLGIMYDKSRLENNLSTSNNSININIKVEK